ncbi:DUF5719 family protein [Curtobacterium ammoniigenes]|uniref:DUF5719 family protein n=1 Tax=Curtobacterium ammoniigenes TaxID=395387 RepID=UPI00082D49AE|nr:DUF5719 family protein [Curtobacterium ammoniigenes]
MSTTSRRPVSERVRRRRRWVGRTSALVVVTLIAAGTVFAARDLAAPTAIGHPIGETVVPVPADAERVCAGSVLQLSNASGQNATTATALGTETVSAAGSDGTVHRGTIDAGPNGGSGATTITAPAGTTTPSVAGSGIQDIEQSDLAGLAAAACTDPVSSAWLVGGSTVTGRTSIITLSNPTAVNATVDLSIYDASGPVSAPGTNGIVVAPHTQSVVPLSGFVSGASATVVHVTTTGGQIVAMMQESVIRTLTPGGVDIIQGSAAPDTTQVIPGVVVRSAQAAQSGSDTADAAPIVRVYVPGAVQANLTLSIQSGGGGGTTVNATAEPGIVTDIPLSDFPDGTYSVSISADRPVVAAARTSTATSGGRTDLGWFASAPALTASVLTDVVNGPGATLTLVNPTRHDATVRLTSDQGSQSVLVTAGATVDTAVPLSTAMRITGAIGLRASVSYQGGSGIAGFPIVPALQASSPLTVFPQAAG